MPRRRGGRGLARHNRPRRHGLYLPNLHTWQLLVIFMLLAFMSATFLRLNNLGMVGRRQAVIEADTSGDPSRIRKSLAELQRYVSSHMNTDLDQGVYLEQSYRRDYDAAVTAAASSPAPQSAVYQQANLECRQRYGGSFTAYVRCVTDRVGSLPQGSPTAVDLPNPEAYRHNYASPYWSPDLAGFSVIATLLIGLVTATRIVLYGLKRLLLQRRFRGITS